MSGMINGKNGAEQRLKIAMLSVHSCPVGNLGTKDTGGMSVYIREVARELGRQGHLVDIYTRVHDPADPQIVEFGDRARLIHLPAGDDFAIPKLALYLHLPDFACNLERYRRENGLSYDLVFNHYWLSAWVGQYVRQWWHVPDITMFHTLGAVKNRFGSRTDEPDLRIETEKEMAAGCRRIIAATAREKEDLQRHYHVPSNKVSVVPCGVNPDLFRPTPPEESRAMLNLPRSEKIVLYVGRIDPLKGVHNLIKAISLMPAETRPRLLIIGGDPTTSREMNHLEELAREGGISGSVDFRGIMPQSELPHYYAAADVTIIPSYYESFGLVALESLACGTPVVAADVGEMKSIIRQGETGLVLADNSPQNLAGGITAALEHLSGRPSVRRKARESVRRFHWPLVAEELSHIFRQVVPEHSAVV
ncbi:MAG: glycosyltransferase [Chloroflexota bacterium]